MNTKEKVYNLELTKAENERMINLLESRIKRLTETINHLKNNTPLPFVAFEGKQEMERERIEKIFKKYNTLAMYKSILSKIN